MTEIKKRYCSYCAVEMDPRGRICPKCGMEQTPLIESVSSAWYLVPFFMGWFGGLIVWFVNKDRDPKKARNFLIFGFVWTAILIIFVITLWITLLASFSGLINYILESLYSLYRANPFR